MPSKTIEHPDHFQVPDEKGGHYIVAKHGLSPGTHSFLKSLCDGGDAMAAGGDIAGDVVGGSAGDEPHFADGGSIVTTGNTAALPGGFQQRAKGFAFGDDPDGEITPETVAAPTQDASDFDATRGAPGGDRPKSAVGPQAPSGLGELKEHDERHSRDIVGSGGPLFGANEATPRPTASGLMPGQRLNQNSAGIDLGAPQTVEAPNDPSDASLFAAGTKQDAAGTMPAPAGTQDPNAPNPLGSITVPKTRVSPLEGESAGTRAAREQAEADTRASAASTEDTNNQRNAVIKEQMAHEEASHAVFKNTQDGLTKKMEDLNTDILNSKIDPDAYWQKRGVGGRITATIGLLLSGFGSGLARNGTPSLALKVIQENINRDIDAQKDNLSTKKGVLAEYHRQFGDSQLAEQAARIHANQLVTSQLQMIANNSTSQQQKIRADQLVMLSKMQAGQDITNLANRNKERYDAAYSTDARNRFELALTQAKAAADAQAAGARPREMQGSKIANFNSVLNDVAAHQKLLEQGWQGPIVGTIASWLPGWTAQGSNAATAHSSADLLREKLASAIGGGVASDARIKQAMASLPDNTTSPLETKQKLDQVVKYLVSGRDEYIREQGGVGFRVAPNSNQPLPQR